MITQIENGMIMVGSFGLPPGLYNVDNLVIKFLVRERNLLHAKLFEQSEMEKEEVKHIESLISQVTELIVDKCRENKP